jgi:hypothetical protein
MQQDVKNKLKDLKLLIQKPQLLISDYFDELRKKVDLQCIQYYTDKPVDVSKIQNDHVQIIERIKQYEKEFYKNPIIEAEFKAYLDESIKTIDLELENSNNLNQINVLIDQLAAEVESKLTLDSILFLPKDSREWFLVNLDFNKTLQKSFNK